MGFAKNEKGVQTDEQGNVVAVKLDRHVLPGDPDWGTYVPVDTAPGSDPVDEAWREHGESNQDETGAQLLVTDEEAQKLLHTKSPVGVARPDSAAASTPGPQAGGAQDVGVMAKLREAKAEQDANAEQNAANSQQSEGDGTPAPKPTPAPQRQSRPPRDES